MFSNTDPSPQIFPLSPSHPNLIHTTMTVFDCGKTQQSWISLSLILDFYHPIVFVYLEHIQIIGGEKYLDDLPCYTLALIRCPCRTIWTVFRACLTFSNTKLAESLSYSPLFLTVQQARTCRERPWRVCASIKCASRWINEQNTAVLNCQFPHQFRFCMTLFGWSCL